NGITSTTTMFRLVLISTLVALSFGGVPFGRSKTPTLDGRIVGGEDASIEEHPYQVSFQAFGSHWCGGSLVRPDIVVTAAHCTDPLKPYPNNLSVRAGSSHKAQGGQVAKVVGTCDHPKFSPQNSYDYDVSVLKLDRPLKLGAGVQLINLQSVGVDVKVGTLARVTGWGALSSGGNSPSILQKVDVPKVDQSECKDAYPFENISPRMTCYGFAKGGKDACQGDSGGPLVVDGKLDGIVSWGYGCANPGEPGVYCKVSNPEIIDHINKCIEEFS
ncbi:hypothetical protein ILUMI_02102, partial [Ignelater luminosus]